MFAHWICVQYKLNGKIDKSLVSDKDLPVWITIQYLIEFQTFHAVGSNFVYSMAHLISEEFVSVRGLPWAKLCSKVQHLTLVNHMDQSTVWLTQWAGRSCAGGTNFSSLKLWQLVVKIWNIFLFTVLSVDKISSRRQESWNQPIWKPFQLFKMWRFVH